MYTSNPTDTYPTLVNKIARNYGITLHPTDCVPDILRRIILATLPLVEPNVSPLDPEWSLWAKILNGQTKFGPHTEVNSLRSTDTLPVILQKILYNQSHVGAPADNTKYSTVQQILNKGTAI